MRNFFTDISGVFEGWSAQNDSLDSTNRAEFSRIVFVFLILCLLIAAFNKMTGYDSANPGFFLFLLSMVIFIGSVAGGRTGEGWFYYQGLTPIHFINNYILAIYMLFIMLAYILNIERRNS
jgi:hypothetical protein